MGLLDWVDPARQYVNKRIDYTKGLLGYLGDLATDSNGARQQFSQAVRVAPKFQVPADNASMMNDAMAWWNPAGLLGKIVYHGSPHKFDKFDASKIGTGEGAQAYGHGLYLADSPGVAGSYIRAGRDVGFTNYDDVNRLADKAFAQAGGDKVAAMKILEDAAASTKGDAKRMNLALARKSIEDGTQSSGLYKADLPDEWIPKMLDWDKPLAKQSPEVKSAVMDRLGELGYSPNKNGLRAFHIENGGFADALGTTLQNGLGLAPADAAKYFSQRGIPGIRYLDGGSRSAGQGSYNYVVFPGLEDQVKILERNGVPINGLLGGY